MRIPDSDDTVYSSAGPALRTNVEPGGTPASTAVWINPDFVQPVSAYKNILINPMFQVNQRNAGTVTTSAGYPADRWWVSLGTSTTVSVSRSITSGGAGGGGTRTATTSFDMPPTLRELAYDVTAVGDAAAGAAYLAQDIEWTKFNGSPQTVTFSMWVKNALTTDHAGRKMAIEFSTADGSTVLARYLGGVFSGISSAWKRYSTTFTIPSFAATNPVVRIGIWFSAGTSYQSRAPIPAATWVGRISCPQLEFGPYMTEFEQRPYALELELCQRWYWRFISSNSPENISQPYRRVGIGAHHPTSNSGVAYMPFPVTMARPATTWGAGGTNAWIWWHLNAGSGIIGYDNVGLDGVCWYQNTTGTYGTGRVTMLYINNANDTYNGMSAEYV